MIGLKSFRSARPGFGGLRVSKFGSMLDGVRGVFSSRFRLRVVSSIDKGARTWLNQATGAVVRAFLVMVVIVLPSVILPGIGTDTRQIVALMALFAGGLVFVEYNAIYPSLIEFRDGAPFNRIRFLMLLAIVLFVSVAVADREQPSTVSGFSGRWGFDRAGAGFPLFAGQACHADAG
jgi:hypothetical protein